MRFQPAIQADYINSKSIRFVSLHSTQIGFDQITNIIPVTCYTKRSEQIDSTMLLMFSAQY